MADYLTPVPDDTDAPSSLEGIDKKLDVLLVRSAPPSRLKWLRKHLGIFGLIFIAVGGAITAAGTYVVNHAFGKSKEFSAKVDEGIGQVVSFRADIDEKYQGLQQQSDDTQKSIDKGTAVVSALLGEIQNKPSAATKDRVPLDQAIANFIRTARTAEWVIEGQVVSKRLDTNTDQVRVSIEVTENYKNPKFLVNTTLAFSVNKNQENDFWGESIFVLSQGASKQARFVDGKLQTAQDPDWWFLDGMTRDKFQQLMAKAGLVSKYAPVRGPVADKDTIGLALPTPTTVAR
jgi:hypothetical protein